MAGNTQEEQRIALFIDFENIAIGVRDAHYRRFDINLILERLIEKGKILSKRAYADWSRYGEYRRSFHEAAIELIEVPQKSVGGKNSADIRLVVDAMDMSFQKEHIDCFCIASGDSDFSPLVSKLKENDKYVIGLGVKNSTSELLIDNCDEFIFYEDLVRRQEAPTVSIPGLSDKHQEAFQILIDSVVALQLDNKGSLWGSMVKETMKRKKPSFNESYYGFRSFSHLLEDAQRRGIVVLRRDPKSGSYVVEDLGAAAQAQGTQGASQVSNDRENGAAKNGNGSAPTSPTTNGAVGHAPQGERPAADGIATFTEPNDRNGDGRGDERRDRPRRRRGGRGRGRGRDREREGTPTSAPDGTPLEDLVGDTEGFDIAATAADPLPIPIESDSSESIAWPDLGPSRAAQTLPTQEMVIADGRAAEEEMPTPAPPPPPTPADTWIARAPVKEADPQTLTPDKASFSLIGWLKGGNR